MGLAKDKLIEEMENACSGCSEEFSTTYTCERCGDLTRVCEACSEDASSFCEYCQHVLDKDD